jgi:Sec-independent protein translocase protein TatA
MLNIGPIELLLIVALVVIIIRPRDWPRVMRQLGRWFGRLQKWYEQIRDEGKRWRREIEGYGQTGPTQPPSPDPGPGADKPSAPLPKRGAVPSSSRRRGGRKSSES